MRMTELYEALRRKIDQHPMSAPEDETIIALLRELFEPEEAELALSMSFKGLEAQEIARRAGITDEMAGRLLERMAGKGIIYCAKSGNRPRYALMPPMPGFFEFSLMKGEKTARNIRMGQLWERYFVNALGMSMHGTSIPMSRVIVVDQKIAYGMTIFPYEHAAELIRSSAKIALGQCQCRFSAGKCDAPLDVCIMLNNWADFTVERDLAVPISEERALDALRRAHEAGLVHTTTNTKSPVPYICNCCSCCCYMLRGVVELKRNTLASSRFLAKVDLELCSGCGLCQSHCPFGALEYDDQGKAEVIVQQCYGCGLCSTTCPEDAISMVVRSVFREPYDSGKSLLSDIATDKQRPGASRDDQSSDDRSATRDHEKPVHG